MTNTKKTINKRMLSGTVSSVAMNKTITVLVVSSKVHPKYNKRYKSSRKYHVHDEKGTAQVGDMVKFVECRPLSKTKRWRLV